MAEPELFEVNVTPPRDAEGVPCGGCPSCGRGESWRWPKFQKDHKHHWICLFCSPPPRGSGPCDFCGVPDHMLMRAAVHAKGICQ